MNFIAFQKSLSNHLVFSLTDIRKLFPNFSRIQLNRWQEKGLIKKIVNKYYIFSDQKLDEEALFVMANTIYSPSYISLEMALSYYHLIPEGVFLITSVTTRQTYNFRSDFAGFHYRKVRTNLFWGYKLIDYKNWKVKFAEPEKALLDFFYLKPHLNSEDDFEGLRINPEVFREIIDPEKFKTYLKAFDNKLLSKRVNIFLNFIEHD